MSLENMVAIRRLVKRDATQDSIDDSGKESINIKVP